MKKLYFIPILFLTLFAYVNNVKADTLSYDYDYSFSISESQLSTLIEEKRQTLIDYWEDNLSSDYPYYYIAMDNVISGSARLDLFLVYSSSLPTYNSFVVNDLIQLRDKAINISIYCSSSAVGCKPSPQLVTGNRYLQPLFHTNTLVNGTIVRDYSPFSYYDSNFTLVYNGTDTLNVVKDNESFLTISTGDIIHSYRDTYVEPQVYTEYNLNNYEYILVTLNNYNTQPFNSDIYVLGSLCLTPVYNYGMTPKSDYYEGYKVQGCSQNYSSYTPTPLYVLQQDIDNHVVYYIKSPNYSTPNSVKINTSKFSVTTITSQNASNPSVTIDGRSYPVIPYNDLTDTAIISTSEGYVSGQVCAVGDTTCMAEATGIDISNLFTHPLELLETLWGSITAVFTTITTFITILPPTLQTFLYVSFMLIVILGILKYLLG